MKVLFAKERVFCVLRAYVLLIGFFVLWQRLLVLYGLELSVSVLQKKQQKGGCLVLDSPSLLLLFENLF